jgi:polar amino acid transport system substrate-binding protein
MKKSGKKYFAIISVAIAALIFSGCSSSNDSSSSANSSCEPGELATVKDGILTIGTGEPAYYPWVIDDAPESGEGFEAAIAYAVAAELGYGADSVEWVRTTFDGAIAPGPKSFDFNLQQYSITEERREVVDFSSPYYKANQAIVSFKGSKIEGVTSLAELAAVGGKLGAAVSTTSLNVIEDQLGLKPSVYNNNADGVAALKVKQIDGLVVDLPTAFYLSAVEIDGGIIVGQIDESDSGDQGFGLLLAKDNPITGCVSDAIDTLTEAGTLAAITEEWLADTVGAPVLK